MPQSNCIPLLLEEVLVRTSVSSYEYLVRPCESWLNSELELARAGEVYLKRYPMNGLLLVATQRTGCQSVESGHAASQSNSNVLEGRPPK